MFTQEHINKHISCIQEHISERTVDLLTFYSHKLHDTEDVLRDIVICRGIANTLERYNRDNTTLTKREVTFLMNLCCDNLDVPEIQENIYPGFYTLIAKVPIPNVDVEKSQVIRIEFVPVPDVHIHVNPVVSLVPMPDVLIHKGITLSFVPSPDVLVHKGITLSFVPIPDVHFDPNKSSSISLLNVPMPVVEITRAEQQPVLFSVPSAVVDLHYKSDELLLGIGNVFPLFDIAKAEPDPDLPEQPVVYELSSVPMPQVTIGTTENDGPGLNRIGMVYVSYDQKFVSDPDDPDSPEKPVVYELLSVPVPQVTIGTTENDGPGLTQIGMVYISYVQNFQTDPTDPSDPTNPEKEENIMINSVPIPNVNLDYVTIADTSVTGIGLPLVESRDLEKDYDDDELESIGVPFGETEYINALSNVYFFGVVAGTRPDPLTVNFNNLSKVVLSTAVPNDLHIKFPETVGYAVFAIPDDAPERLSYYISDQNKGELGGLYNDPSPNIFPESVYVVFDTRPYKVYVSSYATIIENVITVRAAEYNDRYQSGELPIE